METKPALNSWRWEVAGKPISIELELGVVDTLGAEIVRAVGAVPRRGIEVGGILLGNVEPGDPTVVHIRDFEAVPIEYMHGPSYVASDTDFAKFAETVRRSRSSDAAPLNAVGYYRSHTRDGLSLAPEDVKLFSELFPDPYAVILIVHPSMLHASTAGFFFRENGVLHGEKSPLEFPFRRQDLGGGAPPQRSGREERERHPITAPAETHAAPRLAPPPLAERPRPITTRVRHVEPAPDPDIARPWFPPLTPEQPAGRVRMAWTAFLLALLLFGAVAGYYAAGGRLMRNTATTDGPDPYALRLAATGAGDGILIRWNTEAPAIRAAWRGVLSITERQETRAIQLDLPQLRNGSVLYRHVAPAMRFRLDVYLSEQRVLSELADWGSGPVTSAPAEIRSAPAQ